jgi:predicted TIM-barrel fold metal-dependent hydrolase
LFSDDLERFPGHRNAWKPSPAPLEIYLKFARQAGIIHSTHVSAEPYQDDLRYLQHTLEHAPKGFLKGTLLMDPTLEATPERMAGYVKRHPGQIVAMRIHCTRRLDEAPTVTGPIRDRDLMHPNVRKVWRKAGDLKIAIQAHIQPWFGSSIARIAAELPETAVIIDHFGHAGVGKAVKAPSGWGLSKAELGYSDPKDFDQVLRLAKLPHLKLKVSGLQYSSREPFPHRDVRPLARRAFDTFGPERMMWGSFGHSMEQFKRVSEIFDANFDFLSAADRAKIRGLTAIKMFNFKAA